MEILLDDSAVDLQFREILNTIRQHRNGDVAASIKQRGMNYRMAWGVTLQELRAIAAANAPSHLLALKLWNKQWRETMILATLLDDPKAVTEQQMDFWTKSFGNSEIAEQASANLWCQTPWAYIKALEWCRGRKHWVHYTAIHLIGRLALTDKKSPDEIFEPFFEELVPLSKDTSLATVLVRTLVALANRSDGMCTMVSGFCRLLEATGTEAPATIAREVEETLGTAQPGR